MQLKQTSDTLSPSIRQPRYITSIRMERKAWVFPGISGRRKAFWNLSRWWFFRLIWKARNRILFEDVEESVSKNKFSNFSYFFLMVQGVRLCKDVYYVDLLDDFFLGNQLVICLRFVYYFCFPLHNNCCGLCWRHKHILKWQVFSVRAAKEPSQNLGCLGLLGQYLLGPSSARVRQRLRVG